ncbi:MAG: hypothetical protein ACRDF4_10100, partial [Rhabdochlamydiaceae bacterium]
IEIKGGYFIFLDAKMSKIYDHGGLDVQVSGSYPLYRYVQVYGSIEYLERYGTSLNGGDKTKIWEIPLSLGLKPVITICSMIQYYLTIGPRYFFVHAHNSSSALDRNISQNGLGGFLNTGFNFFPCRHLLIDVFGEYSYKRMQFRSSTTNVYGKTVQVGGFVFGVGLGYAF